MKLVSRLAVLGLAVVLVPTALFAQFDQQDYYVSAPGAGGIWRGDADTGVTSPHALGLLVPHYGWFGNDGNFYMPDRGWPAVMRIEPDGTVIPTLDDQAFILSDMEGNSIYRMEYDGTLTLLHDLASTNGLLNWPDGMAFDTDDNLYVANLGNDHIVKIDPAGNASLFFDDPLLVREPGGKAEQFLARRPDHRRPGGLRGDRLRQGLLRAVFAPGDHCLFGRGSHAERPDQRRPLWRCGGRRG